MHKQAVEESAVWISNYLEHCLFFGNKKRLYGYAVEKLKKVSNTELLYLKFGVQTGTSINFFAQNISNKIHGFDSFEGLPEEWKGWSGAKGQFSMNGVLPIVESNVQLVKGLIEYTFCFFEATH
ncbi:MAG: hypothetical protein ABJA79_05945 [Parafilimonas sp.]